MDPDANLIGFDDYRDFPNITRGLVSEGYSGEQIKGILGENFLQVFEVARGRLAESWELRTAISLSRLWKRYGKCAEARDLLAPVYNWFTEGFDTTDLKDAKAMLEEFA